MPAFKDKTHVVRARAGRRARVGEAQPQAPDCQPTKDTIPCAQPASFSPLTSQGCGDLCYRRCWEGWDGFTQGTVPGVPRTATDLFAC